MRYAIAILVVCGTAAALWVGGEMHRHNCIDSGRHECSVLPWKQGERDSNPFDRSDPGNPFDK